MTKQKPKDHKLMESLKLYNFASSFGFAIVIPIVGGAIIGSFIDRLTNLKPIFTLLFIIVGVIAGLYSAVKILKKTLSQNV